MISKTKQNLADRVGELLVKSTLDEEAKNLILDNFDQLQEHAVFKLLDILENENEETETLAYDIDLFLKQQEQCWAKIEKEQQSMSDAIVNKWVQKLS